MADLTFLRKTRCDGFSLMTAASVSPEPIDKKELYPKQGVTKRCRLSWLTNSALVYEPNCGGGFRGLSQRVQLYTHGAQIYFVDLTPYLPYDPKVRA